MKLYCDNCMSSTWSFIHLSCTNRSISISFFHKCINFLVRSNRMLCEVLNIYSMCLTFSNLKIFSWLSFRVLQKILNLFIINLQHTHLYFKPFLIWYWAFSYSIENLITSFWDNPFIFIISNHWITFPTTCLPISKQTTMISVPCIIKNLFSKL